MQAAGFGKETCSRTQGAKVQEVGDKPPQLHLLVDVAWVEVHIEGRDNLSGPQHMECQRPWGSN